MGNVIETVCGWVSANPKTTVCIAVGTATAAGVTSYKVGDKKGQEKAKKKFGKQLKELQEQVNALKGNENPKSDVE